MAITKFNTLYRRFIDEKKIVVPSRMTRASFYLVREYEYVDGTRESFSLSTAPIIFTLFVSKSKDIVHAIKVTNINPNLIKRFFGKLINKDTDLLEMKGTSRAYYNTIVSKVPFIKNDAYRTYKLSGFGRVLELDMNIERLTPKNRQGEGINPKSQKQNI